MVSKFLVIDRSGLLIVKRMKKSSLEMSSRLVLTLLFGIILGMSLSTFVFYPKKLSNFLRSVKPKSKPIILSTKDLYDQTIADELNRDVRVLCWVLTIPENHKTKAIHVKNTWGKRCNKLLFMSSTADFEIDSIPLPVKEGRETLWDKTRFALQYIYNYHFNDADWFIKADDDSYFFMENVRYMLSQYHSKTSLYFGHRYASQSSESGYMAGGGYILSKKALEKFTTRLMHDKDKCRIDNEGAEDYELGRCFENQTIFVDERDELRQKRFFPVGVFEHLNEKSENSHYWYDDMLYYESKYGGLDCCSDSIVNMHYVTPEEMYKLEYLIYNVHPFGIDKNSTEVIPKKIPFDEIIKASDVDSNATDFKRTHAVHHEFDEDEKFRKR